MSTLELEPEEETRIRGIGRAGRTVIALALGGGLICGGVMIAVMTLTGRLSAHALLLTSTGLYLLGVALGLLHAIPLGLLGRDEGVDLRVAIRQQRRALLYTVAALGFGWPVAGWVAMSIVARDAGRFGPWALTVVGWILGLATLFWCGIACGRALAAAYARWPERRVGSALVLVSLVALMILLVGERPMLFGSRLRLTHVGGALVALLLTFWVIGPMVTYVLRALHRIPEIEPDFGFGRGRSRIRDNVLAAVLSGLLLTLLVMPFHLSTARLSLIDAASGGWRNVGFALSRATIDEVLLRVVLSGLITVLVLRWHLARNWYGVALAVALMALLQTAIYLPGMMGLGLPSGGMLAAYALFGALVPGLVLGSLYWSRGLGTALLANAVSLLALAALTIV